MSGLSAADEADAYLTVAALLELLSSVDGDFERVSSDIDVLFSDVPAAAIGRMFALLASACVALSIHSGDNPIEEAIAYLRARGMDLS